MTDRETRRAERAAAERAIKTWIATPLPRDCSVWLNREYPLPRPPVEVRREQFANVLWRITTLGGLEHSICGNVWYSEVFNHAEAFSQLVHSLAEKPWRCSNCKTPLASESAPHECLEGPCLAK